MFIFHIFPTRLFTNYNVFLFSIKKNFCKSQCKHIPISTNYAFQIQSRMRSFGMNKNISMGTFHQMQYHMRTKRGLSFPIAKPFSTFALEQLIRSGYLAITFGKFFKNPKKLIFKFFTCMLSVRGLHFNPRLTFLLFFNILFNFFSFLFFFLFLLI